MAGKLTVFMVGTLAAVLKKTRPTDKYPVGVRILLPFAPQHISKFDNSVVIPRTEPFIGVPWDAIKNQDKPTPLFRRKKFFPVMEDVGEEFGDPVELAFFALRRDKITTIEFKSRSPFTPIDGSIGDKPTKETASYLSWVADMHYYSKDNEVVDPQYMESELPGDAAAVEFDRGTFSVGSVGFAHQFRFINGPEEFDPSVAPTDSFDRTIADVLKLSADLDDPDVTVTVNDDIVLELDGENLSFLVGSEPLSHAFAEPPQPCGTPFFHHEILYQFSNTPPEDSEIVVPVCIDVPHRGKDPDLGRCVPPVFMTAPAAEGDLSRAADIVTPARALSLHIGVNTFSPAFASATSLPAPSKLEACVHDAVAMQKFATTLGFQSLNGDGKNVLGDTNATKSGLIAALKDYGQAAGPGSFFLLTYSGHGLAMQIGGGGWCLNTNILLYSELKKLLAQYFSNAARVMVIIDSCHSGHVLEFAAGVKELPIGYAARSFSEEFGPLAFGEAFESFAFDGKAARLEESAQPPIYFVFACGDNETISDGGKKNLSPFTTCVIAHPHDPTVPVFESNLALCSKKSSHIAKVRPDQIWDKSEPFSMPPQPAGVQTVKSRR